MITPCKATRCWPDQLPSWDCQTRDCTMIPSMHDSQKAAFSLLLRCLIVWGCCAGLSVTRCGATPPNQAKRRPTPHGLSLSRGCAAADPPQNLTTPSRPHSHASPTLAVCFPYLCFLSVATTSILLLFLVADVLQQAAQMPFRSHCVISPREQVSLPIITTSNCSCKGLPSGGS